MAFARAARTEGRTMTILATMVRYNTPLSDSQTVQGICDALAGDIRLRRAYSFLIWDNSPEELSMPRLPIAFAYKHSRSNLGVSGAFNNAMKYAYSHGDDWLLLLDQDTEVTASFLRSMLHWTRRLESHREIALIAPTVRVGDSIVSPRRYLFNHHRAYPGANPGIAPGNPFAINSGCIVRTSALSEIGGFSLDFWLDYSDIELCHRFYLRGYKLWRATDAELQHQMSIMDYDRLMTAARYTNYAYAETAFNDLYKGRLENLAQTLRLLVRSIRQRRKYSNSIFSRITLAQLAYRLRVRRRERIRRFLADSQTRRRLYPAEGIQLEHPSSEFAARAPERKAV